MMFAYEKQPTDFGWKRLKTLKETIKDLADSIPDEEKYSIPYEEEMENSVKDLTFFLSRWEEAKRAAAEKGWEGDFSEQPHVFWLPWDDTFVPAFIFKQKNNGTTFVASPIPLDYMTYVESLDFPQW